MQAFPVVDAAGVEHLSHVADNPLDKPLVDDWRRFASVDDKPRMPVAPFDLRHVFDIGGESVRKLILGLEPRRDRLRRERLAIGPPRLV